MREIRSPLHIRIRVLCQDNPNYSAEKGDRPSDEEKDQKPNNGVKGFFDMVN